MLNGLVRPGPLHAHVQYGRRASGRRVVRWPPVPFRADRLCMTGVLGPLAHASSRSGLQRMPSCVPLLAAAGSHGVWLSACWRGGRTHSSRCAAQHGSTPGDCGQCDGHCHALAVGLTQWDASQPVRVTSGRTLVLACRHHLAGWWLLLLSSRVWSQLCVRVWGRPSRLQTVLSWCIGRGRGRIFCGAPGAPVVPCVAGLLL